MASAVRTRNEHESRLAVQRARDERAKHLVVLMQHHLAQLGYSGALDALVADSGVSMQMFEPADNVDLLSVVQEWEDYYEMRFARKPKLVRKLSSYSDRVDPLAPGNRKGPSLPSIRGGRGGGRATSAPPQDGDDDGGAPAAAPPLAADGARAPRRGARPEGVKPEGVRARPGQPREVGDSGAAAGAGDAASLAIDGHKPAVAARRAQQEAEEEDVWENRIRKACIHRRPRVRREGKP